MVALYPTDYEIDKDGVIISGMGFVGRKNLVEYQGYDLPDKPGPASW
jgi:hypothetical protein